MLFCQGHELQSVKLQTLEKKKLTNDVIPGHRPVCQAPSYSESTNTVVYSTDPEFHGGMSLFSMSPDGSNRVRLTYRPKSKGAAT